MNEPPFTSISSMPDEHKIKDFIRNAAAADIFSQMATEQKSEALHAQISTLPDQALDRMAMISGVPEKQFSIFRGMVRGESNPFIEGLESVDGLLKAGDIILMTGLNRKSQALAKAQIFSYNRALSSHVALVHADFICIDAMPVVGTTNRLVSEVLTSVQDNWRVIRFKNLQSQHRDVIARACVYYLAQPYSIRPSANTVKNFSYCSELARKVFSHASVEGTGIPDNFVVKPADFDRLADTHSEWIDVTETVKPAIDFCKKYPELIRVASKLFIDGLKLNRARYEERAAMVRKIQASAKAGKIQKEKAAQLIREIRETEKKINNKFWDLGVTGN